VVKRLAETPFRNRTTTSLLLALCGGVSLASYFGLRGAPMVHNTFSRSALEKATGE
jgi:hypothetical protein